MNDKILNSFSGSGKSENCAFAQGDALNAKVKKPHKTQGAILKELLALEVDDEKQRKLLTELGIDPNFAGQISLAAIREAAGGNITALKYIRDTMGEDQSNDLSVKPLESIDLSSLSDLELKMLASGRQSDDV